GWMPEQKLWHYRLQINQSELMGQKLAMADISGQFNDQKFNNQSEVVTQGGALFLDAQAHHLKTVPEFSYKLNMQNLNFAAIDGFEQFKTNINGSIQGHGRGNSLQNLRLQTRALIDSSTFKQERIQKLHLAASVADSVLTIQDAVLKSGIADGDMKGRISLQNSYHTNSRLNCQLKIKDIASSAEPANVDSVEANGTIRGRIEPASEDSLTFFTHLNFGNIIY